MAGFYSARVSNAPPLHWPGLSPPCTPAFDASGNLYVANVNNSTIERFTPGGAASVFASTGLISSIGLAFDASGNLYAANNWPYQTKIDTGFLITGPGSRSPS